MHIDMGRGGNTKNPLSGRRSFHITSLFNWLDIHNKRQGDGGGADYLLTYAQRKSLTTFVPQGSRYFIFLIL